MTIHHCSSNLTEQATVLSVEVSSGELLAVSRTVGGCTENYIHSLTLSFMNVQNNGK